MTDTITNEPQALVGEIVFDARGEEIGEITGVYLDQQTRQPEWAAVDLGGAVTLLPLANAVYADDGLVVSFDREKVNEAPYRQPSLPQSVTPEEEAELHRHYDSEQPAPRRRRRTRAAEAATGVASTALDQGQQVASTAVEHGQQVASTAAERGQEVAAAATDQATQLAGTAKEQVAEVGQELTTQARTLVIETKSQLQGQVQSQTERLAETLRQLGNEVLALAEGRPEEAGPLARYAREAGDKLARVGDEVEARGPEGLLEELQTFARTRPAAFVLGAAIAGFGVGRLLRGASDSGDDSTEQPPGRGTASAPIESGSATPALRAPSRRRAAATSGTI